MNNTENKTSPVPVPKKKRRFLRILLFLILGILLFFVLVFFSIKVLVATGQVQDFVANSVRKNFHRELQIETVKLRLFRGIELIHLSLMPSEDTIHVKNEFPVRQARIEKVTLKYSLSALLHKKLKITEIWIEKPELEILSVPATDSLQSTKATEEDTAQIAQAEQPNLPLSFELDLLKLRDAKIKILALDSSVQQKIFLGDLDFYIDDLELPKGEILQQPNLIRGRITLVSEEAPFSFSQKNQAENGADSLMASGLLQLMAELTVNGLDSVLAKINISIDSFKLSSPRLPKSEIEFPGAIALKVASEFCYGSKSLSIDPLTLSIGRHNWLTTKVSVESLLVRPTFTFTVTRGSVPLKQLVQIARAVLPDSVMRPIYLLNDQSSISLTGTRADGWLLLETQQNNVRVKAQLSLKDFGLTYNYGQYELAGLNLTARALGSIKDNQISGLNFTFSAKYDTVAAILPDSSKVFTGKATLYSESFLNDQLLPMSAKGSVLIENILGSTLKGEYNVSSPTDLKALRGAGQFSLTHIDLERFPNLPVNTKSNVAVNFFVHTLDTLRAQLSVETDSIKLSLPDQAQVFSPLYITGQLIAGTDPSFEDVVIRNVDVNLNDLLIGKLAGHIRKQGKAGFSFTIPSLYVKHTPLLEYLPQNIKYQFENLSISGRTNLKATVTGRLDNSGQVHYDATANLFTTDTNIDYPDQFFNIGGVHLDVTAHANADSVSTMDVSLAIDSVRTENLPHPLTLFDNNFGLQIWIGNTDTIIVNNGHFTLPTLMSKGEFTARVTDVSTNPKTEAHFHLVGDISDTLRLIPEIILAGAASLQADISMDTSMADFNLHAVLTKFSAVISDTIKITDIDANLRLAQKIDLVQQKLIGPTMTEVYTPTQTSIDYLTYRPYYRNTLTEMSTVHIGRIQVLNFAIDHFKAELLLGNGFVEIASFLADLYGGNIGGRFSINLAGGDLSAARYNLSAHFSGINSSLLLPQQGSGKVKKSIINANMKLFGRGLDPEKGIDIGGYFYVTDIGPKVLSNLLKALEAQRTDSGIGYTQNLISWGFKPKLVSFEIKNGYFYPSIFFAQPWYFPAHLSGGRVELARIPVMFFVQMATQNQMVSRD